MKPVKPVKCSTLFFLHRLWRHEKVVCILAIVSIFIIFAYYGVTKQGLIELLTSVCAAIASKCEDLINFLTKYKDAILAFAISYVSGFILYLLTNVLSIVRKYRTVLLDIMEDIRYLKDTFREMSSELSGEDWCENVNWDDVSKKMFVQEIVGGQRLPLNASTIDSLKNFIPQLDNYIFSIFRNGVEYLEQNELDMLLEIKRAKVLELLRYHINGNFPCYTQEELKTKIQDLIDVNKKVVQLYELISKRILKNDNNETN